MKCGILLPADGEKFDPLVHIDLDICTVTIDAWITNKAMKNYSTSNWNWVRDLIRRVPLWHSYWRVDLSLGDEIWVGKCDKGPTPIPPSPAFSMPMVPIAPWVSSLDRDLAVPTFECENCTASFNTARGLVRHCQVEHDNKSLWESQYANHQEQDTTAMAFWDTTCYECGKVFHCLRKLTEHRASGIHTDAPRYVCSECGAKFDDSAHLERHMASHTDARPLVCDVCGKDFKTLDNLRYHQIVHTSEKRFKCDDCDKTFKRKEALVLHRKDAHPEEEIDGTCDKCGKVFESLSKLRWHISTDHSEKNKFECDKCDRKFSFKTQLDKHLASHSETKSFVCNLCSAAYKRKDHLTRHMKNSHGA
ncbi:uncharacterized protein TRIVIDRAFT_217401 [Trichoderma virens Gv29-8]|uniref:C2H2-type domain-containing protein n=1 Tax=Hypocrea virens (strain Gv29-8 / FGSC 10586) TaxID=413071 RepID=G9MFN9_HYPVG|nr:uncharacterized protein TRIVIDRAFT_217401 [Trichoderma virens Gv29-8]EHK27525.1 hypothetical protein TRIVIDRAFT_217401 [Trichoderma virens Gv29-8]UKZ57240.1 hypothetical protein TrVGV298_011093 [Trichoderma virens]